MSNTRCYGAGDGSDWIGGIAQINVYFSSPGMLVNVRILRCLMEFNCNWKEAMVILGQTELVIEEFSRTDNFVHAMFNKLKYVRTQAS